MTRVATPAEADAHRRRPVKAAESEDTMVNEEPGGGEPASGAAAATTSVTKRTAADVMALSTAPGVHGSVTSSAPHGGGSHPGGRAAAVAALANRVTEAVPDRAATA